MTETIHGHEVMAMMTKSGKTYTRSELNKEVDATFGADSRFHTCHDSCLTTDELINFLVSKGKCIETAQGVKMSGVNAC